MAKVQISQFPSVVSRLEPIQLCQLFEDVRGGEKSNLARVMRLFT